MEAKKVLIDPLANPEGIEGAENIEQAIVQLSKIVSTLSGGGGTETDPIYTAEKPSIALKSEVTPKADKDYVDTQDGELQDQIDAIGAFVESDPIYIQDKPNLVLKSSPRLSSVLTIGRTLPSPIVINSSAQVDLTWLFAGGGSAGAVTTLNENSPFYYDATSNLIRCTDETTDAFSFQVFLVLNGSVSNGGDSDVFQFSLHRPDNSIFRTRQDGTVQSATLTSAEIANFNSYIGSGGADNFQLPIIGTPTGSPPVYPIGTIGGGFRIKMSRINGNAEWTLSAATQQIRILS